MACIVKNEEYNTEWSRKKTAKWVNFIFFKAKKFPLTLKVLKYPLSEYLLNSYSKFFCFVS